MSKISLQEINDAHMTHSVNIVNAHDAQIAYEAAKERYTNACNNLEAEKGSKELGKNQAERDGVFKRTFQELYYGMNTYIGKRDAATLQLQVSTIELQRIDYSLRFLECKTRKGLPQVSSSQVPQGDSSSSAGS